MIPLTDEENKFVCNLYDKKICCSYQSSKTSIESWTDIRKVHRVIQFNQEAWLKFYIEMNNKLRREAKYDFQINFEKTMKNVKKH